MPTKMSGSKSGNESSNSQKKKKFNSTTEDRPKPVPGSTMRSVATVRRLKMYKSGKPTRDRSGVIMKEAEFQRSAKSGEVSRIAPNRKWFGNTGVISQDVLQNYLSQVESTKSDPYKVLMKPSKLPLSLLVDRKKISRINLFDAESFDRTFGKKATRKAPNISVSNMEEYASKAKALTQEFVENEKILQSQSHNIEDKKVMMDPVFTYGQSKRIWGELFKVIDSSDVVIQVLDARDPMGTRSAKVENYLKTQKPYKHLVFVMNKCDLVPSWIAKDWLSILSKSYPTIAFHADLKKPFGKTAVVLLLKQLYKLHKDKKNISVGFIGYPNVGKSSIINALREKKVCNVAPVPGETKVWQYVNLTKKIYLIDCPGVVYPSGEDESDLILKGVIRVQKVKDAADHIPSLMKKVTRHHLERTYNIEGFTEDNFLENLAISYGRLLKGGEPDLNTMAKAVLYDFQTGKLPHFVKPPKLESNESGDSINNASEIALTDSTETAKATSAADEIGMQHILQILKKHHESTLDKMPFLQVQSLN